MLNFELLKNILIISIASGCVTTLTTQKIKEIIIKKKYIFYASILVSMIIGTLFCKSFSNINWIYSIWGGFFTWIDSQMLYNMLEDKVFTPFSKMQEVVEVPKENEIKFE